MNASSAIPTMKIGTEQFALFLKELKNSTGEETHSLATQVLNSFPIPQNDNFYGVDFFSDSKLIDISSYLHLDEYNWYDVNCIIDQTKQSIIVSLTTEGIAENIFSYNKNTGGKGNHEFTYTYEEFFSNADLNAYSPFELILGLMGLSLLPKSLIQKYQFKDVLAFSLSLVIGKYEFFIPDQSTLKEIKKNISLSTKRDIENYPEELVRYKNEFELSW
jgi:hypothetical protein